MCFTSIPDDLRSSLIQKCQAMGARTKLDLCSDVTHLIVGEINTAKYKYAAKNRADLKLMQQSWIGDMHAAWLEGRDINVGDWEATNACPAFFGTDLCLTNFHEDRAELEDLIVAHGGTHSPDLTRACTHLVAARPTGKKYEFALKWGIPVVHRDWVTDCIERRAVLDEKLYDLSIAPQDRERAWTQNRSPLKRRREELTGKRKIRKKTNVDWQEVLSVSQKHHADDANVWEETAATMQIPHTESDKMAEALPKGLFTGLSFDIGAFPAEKQRVLTGVIERNSGHVSRSSSAVYKVIPHNSASFPQNTISEWWLEHALERQSIPPDDICMGGSQVEGIKGLDISQTGFSGITLLHLQKLVTLLGANFHPTLTMKRDLLVSNTRIGQKFTSAKKWGVRIVSADWLRVCAKNKCLESIEPFAMDGLAGDISHRAISPLNGSTIRLAASIPSEKRAYYSTLVGKLGAKVVNGRDTPAMYVVGTSANHDYGMCLDTEWIEECFKQRMKVDPSAFVLKKARQSPSKLSENISSLTKLLSSPKAVRKRTRIIGRAASTLSSLSPNLSPTNQPEIEEMPSQRVGYVDQDALKEKEKLMRALGRHDPKIQKPREMSPVAESRTRKH